MKSQKKKKRKSKTFPQLKKRLDKVFSLWIRQRDKGRCFTCGKTDDPKYMQCGHFVSRVHLSTRWNEKNCNTQCAACNVFKHGNMDVYALRLIEKYGRDILLELHNLKSKTVRFTAIQLQELIDKYDK